MSKHYYHTIPYYSTLHVEIIMVLITKLTCLETAYRIHKVFALVQPCRCTFQSNLKDQ